MAADTGSMVWAVAAAAAEGWEVSPAAQAVAQVTGLAMMAVAVSG